MKDNMKELYFMIVILKDMMKNILQKKINHFTEDTLKNPK
jgi:hypothetical protein